MNLNHLSICSSFWDIQQQKPSDFNVIWANTFLPKLIQLRYLPCVKPFGLPVSVGCPVHTDNNRDRVSPFGVCQLPDS